MELGAGCQLNPDDLAGGYFTDPSAGGSGAVPLYPAGEAGRLAAARSELAQAEEAFQRAGTAVLTDAQDELNEAAGAVRLAGDHLTGDALAELDQAEALVVKNVTKVYNAAVTDLNTAEDTLGAGTPPADFVDPGTNFGSWPFAFRQFSPCVPPNNILLVDGPRGTVGLTPEEWVRVYSDLSRFEFPPTAVVRPDPAGVTIILADGSTMLLRCVGGPPPPPPGPPAPPKPPPAVPPVVPPVTPPPPPPPPPGGCPPSLCDLVKACGGGGSSPPPAAPPPCPTDPPERTCDCKDSTLVISYNGTGYVVDSEPDRGTWLGMMAAWGPPAASYIDGCITYSKFANGAEVTEKCKEGEFPPLPPGCPPVGPPTSPKPPPTSPPPPAGPPAVPPTAESGVGWDNINACKLVDALTGTAPGIKFGDYIADAFDDSIDAAGIGDSGFVTTAIVEALRKLAAGLGGTIDTLNGWATDAIGTITGNTQGLDPRAKVLAGAVGFNQFISAYTKYPLDYLGTSLQYQLQYTAPQFLPSQAGIDAIYQANIYTKDQWECYTKALGNLPKQSYNQVRATRSRPNVAEMVELFYREKIDRPTLDKELRNRGVLDKKEGDIWVELFKRIPTAGDLVRFMVRDAADPAAVELGDLDADLDKKFAGKIRDWAKAQGVDDEYMKFIWRSHWELPSPTQLFEMLHRLRPDKVGDKLGITPELVKKTLQQNDLAPGFVDRMMAVSYHPITLTDIQRGYLAGTIPEADLQGHLEDGGYSAADAQTVAKIIKDDSVRRVNNMTGQWTPRAVCQAYMRGLISRDKADTLLKQSITDESKRTQALDNAEMTRDVKKRAKCLAGIRRRYFVGEIGIDEALASVRRYDVEPDQAQVIVDEWFCERESGQKEPAVAQLRLWFNEGVISAATYQQRLVNLRYEIDDAAKMVKAAVAWLERAQSKKGTLRSEYGREPEDPKPPKRNEPPRPRGRPRVSSVK